MYHQGIWAGKSDLLRQRALPHSAGQHDVKARVSSCPTALAEHMPWMPPSAGEERTARGADPTLVMAMAMAVAYEQAAEGDRVDYDLAIASHDEDRLRGFSFELPSSALVPC